jgi:hypothetical protein
MNKAVLYNWRKGPGNDIVYLATKLEVFFNASHHVQSVWKISFDLGNNNELCFSLLFNKHTYPANDVTRCAESATYILHIFAYNFGTR